MTLITCFLSRNSRIALWAWILAVLALAPQRAWALGQEQYVLFSRAPGSFMVMDGSSTANIFVDPQDWPGVIRAARDLASDINAITGKTPEVVSNTAVNQRSGIIVGTVGKSA